MQQILNEKEKLIFASLVQFGASTVVQIAKDTNLNRSALYHTLSLLKEKGIVFEIKKNGTTLFQTLSKAEFIAWMERKKKDIEKNTVDLVSLYKKETPPILHSGVKYFEGFDAVKKLYGETWRENREKQILAITDYKKAYETMNDFFEQEYFPFRVSAGVNVKSLLSMDAYGKRDSKRQKELLREMRFLDVFKELGIELNVFDDKTMIVAFDKKKPMGLMLKNKLISDAFRRIFDILWKQARKG